MNTHVHPPALLTDRRRFQLSAEDLRRRVPGAMTTAFGRRALAAGHSEWTLRLRRSGLIHDVVVRVAEHGPNDTEVTTAVMVQRAWSGRLSLPSATIAMTVSWLAAAVFTFVDFHQSIYDSHWRVIPWVITIAMGLFFTAVVRHLAVTGRVNASGALAPMQGLWDALE
jgi:hypothetical protein